MRDYTQEKLRIAVKTLRDIARCKEASCERYVAKVDAMAVAALIQIELLDD